VQFDTGAIYLSGADVWRGNQIAGTLRLVRTHVLDDAHVAYHRDFIAAAT
jgi:hypothetical protein